MLRRLSLFGLIVSMGCSPATQPNVDAGGTPTPPPTREVHPDGGVSPPETGAPDAQVTPGADATAEAHFGHEYTHSLGRAEVLVHDRTPTTRSYELSSTAELRDPSWAHTRAVEEQEDQPVLRSGHDLFDALFALAMEEMRENQVDDVRDWSFGNNDPLPCRCFETGELWKYVWTRDIAYSAHLALAALDPKRTMASLRFKLSQRKGSVGGGRTEIMQDTGTGGSYPVSSDRVVWALGAYETLQYLPEPERSAFATEAYAAIVNTVLTDRAVAFDPADGLYRGEESFLDWREQSYPSWTADDTVHIGMAKALSTNSAHLRILQVAAALAAERGEDVAAARYSGWASDLAARVREALWDEEAGLFSSYKWTPLDPSTVGRYDWLGQSLAVLTGIASDNQARSLVSRYPHTELGPPVMHPQQPFVPIYHNRAIWPFVTAYGLLAARAVENDRVVSQGVESLVRGAALNLSNMESFEFLSQRPWVEDGEYSGPVVSSRRQLWSVAGYLSMVLKVLAGWEAGAEGTRFLPFIPRAVRAQFTRGDEIRLRGLPYRGRSINLTIALPPFDGRTEGAYAVDSVTLNGTSVGTGFIREAQLSQDNEWVVVMKEGPETSSMMAMLPDPSDYRNVFAPREPENLSLQISGGQVTLSFDAPGESGVHFNVYKDGALVAASLTEPSWTDPEVQTGQKAPCYAVESVHPSSGLRSQHTPAVCAWGARSDAIQEIPAASFQASGGNFVFNHGREHYESWGDPQHWIEVPSLTPNATGEYLLQLDYGNGAGPVDTGITAALKWVTVHRLSDDSLLAEGPIAMPQLGTWDRWGLSSFLPVSLTAGETVRIRITDQPNMSYFDHFSAYTGTGGGPAPFNRANIAAVRLLAR